MLVTDYNEFVKKTNQYKNKGRQERHAIALYGLVGEIGSLLAAVKKALLGEGDKEGWGTCNPEIIEEIGDVIWYCFSLAQIENEPVEINILTNDIALLKKEIAQDDERGRRIRAVLDRSKKDEFLARAGDFPNTKDMRFHDYQELAFLTSRTQGRDLIEVCLAVLFQLGAELLRTTLPEIELTLNQNVADREPNIVLGEIAWHLAAISSLYGVSLDEIAERNVKKVGFRSDRTQLTPLHDEEAKESEKFPRIFDVAFISVAKDKSRMYFDGRRLGDELTDNAYEDDGYRFHDVMHLANAAHLGWSPVLRRLLGRKRRSSSKVDEVEDGARAAIVEELVLKAIHTEGKKLAPPENGAEKDVVKTFSDRGSITFRLLKSLHEYVEKLEAEKNKFWEWENAIFEGAEAFYHLRKEQQGTITVDMVNRSLTFSPDVCVEFSGMVSGVGSSSVPENITEAALSLVLTLEEREYVDSCQEDGLLIKSVACKRAIFAALGLEESADNLQMCKIKLMSSNRVCVRAGGAVQAKIWAIKAVSFRLTFVSVDKCLICTAVALSDKE